MKRNRSRLALLCVAAALVATGPAAASPDDRDLLYEVHAPLGAEQALFAGGFDVMEHREGDSLFVLGDSTTGVALERAGFTATVDQVLPEPSAGFTATADTFFGGYHTVDAHRQHLDQVARDHPDLATVVDYGDSWRKTRNRGGHDLLAICITRKRTGDCALTPDAPKPRFFVMGQLHSRELTTGEVAWRWIDHLVGSTDPEVAALLDTTEFWVVPVANPDGVQNVQQGGDSPVSHRKNGNDTDHQGTTCGTVSHSHHGVDLNRNTGSNWGLQNASDGQCDQTYRGTGPASEPETQALQALWRSLYRDRRAADPAQPAPTDTTGLVLSLHSYGNYVLFPWSGGAPDRRTGNDAPLRDLAQRLAELAGPGWQYGQSGQVLYSASGTTDDWVYDDLGVASFVWEMGPPPEQACGGFFPAHSCQDGFFWPKALPMLLHSARHTAAPYAPVPEPPTGCATRIDDTDTPIVTRTPPVTVSLTVTGCAGDARSTSQVEVHFKNLMYSIITLDLIAPDGTAYRLQHQRVSTLADPGGSFTVDLSRESRDGTWQLRVHNVIWVGPGDLDRWSLTL
ncbi:M14 family zinc carboxypeptidase [Saccharothrix texasensis]|uniref:Proprotein convertase P-domain-containing protein n=1 Tax=Saccharothrix texasensis TaxID=103734 RepID=A0A3N1H3S1_9PSEU|nr:M14 family zinc carboxypeptidase [Saccharothrix texasensis]ROP37167.1 proprotein convertase P-domain-containing protein [Saccharothrix texasensis]